MTTAHTPRTIPEFTLGDRLRKARELTGLSVRRFAEEIGVSHGTITNAEGDRRAVRPITIKAYAMKTGVPFEWLATGVMPNGPEDGPDGGSTAGHARTDVWLAGLVAA